MQPFPLRCPEVIKSLGHELKSRQNGFALVLVLWILSLMTIMAGSFALTMRRESSITAGIKETANAAAAAEAGIAFAEMMLLHPDQNKRWRADGNVYEVNFGDTKIRLRLLSEAGKININKADLALLQSVMARAPIDEERQAKIIGAILDWRDADDLLNIEGAEKREYKKAGLKYQPRNKPFQTLEELQMVLGMDARLYNWLQPLVTLYSGQNKVNLKVATSKVLNLLPGMDPGMIESFVAARLESARAEQPMPEFPTNLLAGRAGGSGDNEATTIVSEARLADETSAVITATVVKTGNNVGFVTDTSRPGVFNTLRWQRNPPKEEPLFSDEMTALLVKQYVEPELRN
jgi:general secretion pathway protein K